MTANINKVVLPLVLISIMAATRFHHFGSSFALPDASLAVFFLAGLYIRNASFLALLWLEAGLIDYLAINHMGVSDFCISPAYLFLIPTYGLLWLAGWYSRAFAKLNIVSIAKAFTLATLATIGAFVLSNGSFYLLSGQFGQLGWARYLQQANEYFLPYLRPTLIYLALGLAFAKLFKAVSRLVASQSLQLPKL